MYNPTEQDRTPEGVKNLLKNYHVMATYMGGLAPAKREDGSTIVYKVEGFFVENVRNEEDMANILRSDVLGLPHGIYLEARNVKRAPAVLFNIFNEDEQKQLKEANLPEDAIQLMKESCFSIMEQYRGLGTEKDGKTASDGETEAVADQVEYDRLYKQYDELKRDEIADLISEEFSEEFKGKPHFSSKPVCIQFYILHKHQIKPALTGT